MSNIQTRIILRNDTLARWEASDLVLNKGEMAIATLPGGELAEIRIGDGTHAWANSLKINVNADQISGIVDTIKANTKKYQVVSSDVNSWKLQEAPLSATGDEWVDVAGSTWAVDFSGIESDITYLSGELSDLQELVGDTRTSLNTVSSDYLKASDFSALSNEIGLSAASSSNTVVTQKDIADLAGAMHFRGAVTPEEGQTDIEAIEAAITDPASGDVVIVTTTSKEYVYNGTSWIELGDEILYATKAELNTTVNDVSVALSTDYVGKIGDLETTLTGLINTVSGETLVSANAYTDEQIAALSIDDYATITYVNEVSSALSTDYVGKISTTSAEAIVSANAYTDEQIAALSIDDYATITYVNEVSSALSTDYVEKIGTTSAETLISANAYTDEQIAALSIDDYIKHGEVVDTDLSGFFVLDCGDSTLRTGEPAVTAG